MFMKKLKRLLRAVNPLKWLPSGGITIGHLETPVDSPPTEPATPTRPVHDKEEAIKVIDALSKQFEVPVIIFKNNVDADQMLRDMRRGIVMAKRLKELGTDLPTDYLN